MTSITVHELNQLFQQGLNASTLVIDVRTAEEHQATRISGVVNRPLDELDTFVAEFQRYQKIYVHCQSGNRSQKACEKLSKLGIHHHVNVLGGIGSWQQAGLPTHTSQGMLPIIQQVVIGAGALVLLGMFLSAFVHPSMLGISALVGAGLLYAGVSGQCFMAMLLAKMPWNAPTAECVLVPTNQNNRHNTNN